MSNQGIVLLHGAGLGGFIWEELRPGLEFPSWSIDFPNRGRSGENHHLHFEDYSQAVIREIEKRNANQIILVAHSIAGCIGLKVAEHFGERIAGFAGVGAAIPANGNSFVSCLPYPQRILLPLMMKFAGTKPPKKAIENALCSDLDEEKKERVLTRFTPESRWLYMEKSNAGIPDTPRMYIRLGRDKEFPLPLQDRMAKNLKAREIPMLQSGHLPMLSRPAELADQLNRFAKRCLG